MKLSSLFGLRSRLRQLRIAAGEGALAAKDRVQLLQLAWDEEKQRLQVDARAGDRADRAHDGHCVSALGRDRGSFLGHAEPRDGRLVGRGRLDGPLG